MHLAVPCVILWLDIWFLDYAPFLCKTHTPDTRAGQKSPSLSWGPLERTLGVAPCRPWASSLGFSSLHSRGNSSPQRHTPSESTYGNFFQLGLCRGLRNESPWEVRCSRHKWGAQMGLLGAEGHLPPIPTAQCLPPATRGQHHSSPAQTPWEAFRMPQVGKRRIPPAKPILKQVPQPRPDRPRVTRKLVVSGCVSL